MALLFDILPVTNKTMILSLNKQRAAYTGPCLRVKSTGAGNPETDIQYDPVTGEVDLAGYDSWRGVNQAYVITRYESSGNAFHVPVNFADQVVLKADAFGKPCLYQTAGTMGSLPSFNAWNGVANLNLILAYRTQTPRAHFPVDYGNVIKPLISNGGTHQFRVNGVSGYNTYADVNYKNGQYYRWQFEGGAGTDLLQARVFRNNREMPGVSVQPIPATIPNGTGLTFNADAGGSGLENEVYDFYAVDYQLTAPQLAALNASLKADYFGGQTKSKFMPCGDSMSVSYNTNVTAPTQTYPKVLEGLLETYLGTVVDMFDASLSAEVGAQTERVLQLYDNGGGSGNRTYQDAWVPNDVAIVWCGTNDLALGDSAAIALAGTKAMVQAAFNAGQVMPGNGLVPVLNMLPRTDLGAGNAAFETKRTTYNAGLAAEVAGIGMVIDVASLAGLVYFDDVHITTASYGIIAQKVFDDIGPHLMIVPTADFTIPATMNAGDSLVPTNNSTGSNLSYEWRIDPDVDNTVIATTVEPELGSNFKTGVFEIELTVINALGSDSVRKTITVATEIIVVPANPLPIEYQQEILEVGETRKARWRAKYGTEYSEWTPYIIIGPIT